MALFDSENNVGQFGADNSNIIRYKQAAEYAEDSRLYAAAAAEAVVDADNLMNRAEELLEEAQEIAAEVDGIQDQVTQLQSDVDAATEQVNNAVALAQGSIDAANTAKDAAETAATNSANSASAASDSATASQASATASANSATSAQTSATNASTSATNAANSASAASADADRAEAAADSIDTDAIEAQIALKANKGDNSDITSLSGLTTPLSAAQGGTGNTTGNAATSTALATARTFIANLASTTAASFNGTANASLGVTGILPVGNGGTGSSTGNAPSATALATARTVLTNLSSNTSASFDGTANITPGVSGTLPIANGGTGGTTAATARTALSAAQSGANSDITSITGLTTPLTIGQGGTGNASGNAPSATTAATATALSTARTFQTNLASTATASFNGTANVTPGITGTLPIANGGTGATTVAAAATNLNLGASSVPYFSSIELSSASPFIDFHYGSTAADYNVRLINNADNYLSCSGTFDAVRGIASRSGFGGTADANVPFFFYWNYVTTSTGLYGFVGNTGLGNISFVAASDKMLKTTPNYKTDNEDVLEQIKQWKVASFKYKARGIIPESDEKLGFIANDLILVSPEVVKGEGLPEDYDIETDFNNPNSYNLDQVAMIAKLTQAIQQQQKLIEELQQKVGS